MIRPAVLAGARRWQGVIEGAMFILAGAWAFAGGTLVWQLPGLAAMALGIGWAVNGWRRARFQADPSAPGLIEVDEGRIRFLHPVMGGEVSLNDLAELKLVTLRGRRLWQMRDLAGARLIVPLESAGAGDLADALSSLPGLSSASLVAALDADAAPSGTTLPGTGHSERPVWMRPGSGIRPV